MTGRLHSCGLALAATVLVAGCGLHGAAQIDPTARQPDGGTAAQADPAGTAAYAMPDPGPLAGPVRSADVLIVGQRTLPEKLRKQVRALAGVRAVEPLSVASVAIGERSVTVAGIDPKSYRRFAPDATAGNDAVWQRIASGDAAITHQIGRDFQQPLGGDLALRSSSDQHRMRIGAYATTVPQVDAVVNERRSHQLGMKPRNAIIVSIDQSIAERVHRELEQLVGKRANVERLTGTPPTTGKRHAAYLTGGAVAKAVGSFSYRYFPDGSVEPEARWVAANIRTGEVPLLGRVTCHRVMLGQLRSALAEVVERGLADRIDVGDYGGCYVPRFIGRDPRRGLSLHTWGIAIDLNVAGNQRGTVGEIDREVVGIFKKWGFAWGGDWAWTDPMHFELAALVR